MKRDDFSWMIGGAQGSGVDTPASIFAKAVATAGYYVYGTREYYSNIKGEHSYFQVRFGLSPLEAGLLYLPTVLPQVVTSRLAGRVADSVGPAVPIVVGMAILSLAMIGVSYAAEEQSYVAMIPAMVVFGIGISLVVTPTRVAAQAAVGEDHQGVVAGVMSTFNRVGAVLGVAVVGALIVALQHGRTIHLLAHRGISPDSNDRAALDSILYHGHSGSKALADDPSRLVGPIRHAADDAFGYAFATGMARKSYLAIS